MAAVNLLLRRAIGPQAGRDSQSALEQMIALAGQKSGEVLDLGHLKCIDTFCHGGGLLTALEVGTGKVWQANLAGEMRNE